MHAHTCKSEEMLTFYRVVMPSRERRRRRRGRKRAIKRNTTQVCGKGQIKGERTGNKAPNAYKQP